MSKTVSIQRQLKALNERPEHRQRLGVLTPVAGYVLLLSFAIPLAPLHYFLRVFNQLYFPLRRAKPIDRSPYFNHDRHRILHLSLVDKLWCEYCEWANGTLQWALAITSEIERRYCPVKNECDAQSDQPKEWRARFLSYAHTAEELEAYYREQYPRESGEA